MLGSDMLLKFLKAQPGVCFVVFNNADNCLLVTANHNSILSLHEEHEASQVLESEV